MDKFPDPAKLARREEVLSRGAVYDEHQTTSHRNVVSTIVEDAARQLAAFDGQP